MKKKFKRAPEQMDWPTYNYIKSLIEAQIEVLDRNYLTAMDFIPPQSQFKRPTGRDVAHKIYSDRRAELKAIKEQLHTTVAVAYKTHPNKEMREFWGLTE